MLNSADVLQSSLGQWYSEADPPLQGESPTHDLGESDIFRLKLEHMQRFRKWMPCSDARYQANIALPWPGGSDGWPHLVSPFAFCRETAAWIDDKPNPSNHVVRARNLRTGEVRTFVGQGRERLMALAVTDGLLAALTYSG